MTVDDVFAEVVGFAPWGPPDGPAEWLQPAWGPSSADTYKQPPKHGEPKLRVLPDGSPQLTLRNSAGARVVRLGAAPVQVSAKFVRDAVATSDGNVVLLDQVDFHRFDVRCATPDGVILWSHSFSGKSSDGRDVNYKSRLLIDARERVFLAPAGSLFLVDGPASPVLTSWPGGHAVMCPDGRISYARAEEAQVVSWVVRDLDKGVETTTELGRLADPEVRDVIGVDAAGHIYRRGWTKIARELPGHGVDWLVDIGGITVSEQYGVSILAYGEDRSVARFDNGGRVPVEDGGVGRLVGRGDDGEYILHRLIRTNWYDKPDAQLTYVDRDGRVLRTEFAPDDMWMTMDIAQQPDFSSVTPDGAVLVAVNSELGVHVVRLTAGEAP